MNKIGRFDSNYELDHRYQVASGRIFLTGIQALVRLPLVQHRLDTENGLNTAGFIAGYRGSPLASYDRNLWQSQALLDNENITFLPAVNEDMAATAIIGTQEVENDPNRTVDGVFSIWYGKGPGVDRSLDALKHANALGTSKHGGVLVVFGDDHGCISSAMPHQSEQALMSLPIPILNPSCVAEYVRYGLYGFALSRFSGAYVGFKTASETVESGRSMTINETLHLTDPPDYTPPDIGLHNQWPNSVGVILEERNFHKYWAIQAFIEQNSLNEQVFSPPKPRLAIITTGKAHLDVMGALKNLGVDEAKANKIGLAVLKIGLSYPLARKSISAFSSGLEKIIVVEEKRSFVELQLKEILFNMPAEKRPLVIGKDDGDGRPFIPKQGELVPSLLAPLLKPHIDGLQPHSKSVPSPKAPQPQFTRSNFEISGRTPYFCSGCPHNTSTNVPDGSIAFAGVGCHVMASWMGRNTQGIIQMGGEGANWVGRAPFTGNGHVFQNMGDGTYFHSGQTAIRQAVAANINITYKILFNGAVGMTGGQPMDGDLSPEAIARQMKAEGVQRIALVSDDIDHFDKSLLPPETSFHDRSEMEELQKELRQYKGVSILIYDQMCAAEKRRLRKRNAYPEPDRHVVINTDICDGCGDCSLVSNCLSIIPVSTPFGTKRAVDQSTCNKDFTCLNGYCPAFVTVKNATIRKQGSDLARLEGLLEGARNLAEPKIKPLDDTTSLVVAGVGGTGIVTVAAVMTMAAHIEGLGVSSLDFMGMAQKGGAVLSHVKFSPDREFIEPARIDKASGDVMLACDAVVATDPEAMAMLKVSSSAVVVNTTAASSADFILHGTASLEVEKRLQVLRERSAHLDAIDAGKMATILLGDSVYANMLIVGAAWQAGHLPLSKGAILRAIELNGVSVEKNTSAFAIGRMLIANPDFIKVEQRQEEPETLAALVRHRVQFLTEYQNAAYGERYRKFVEKVETSEPEMAGGIITRAVAENLFRLMAYKDEYEVSRLYVKGGFSEQLKHRFDGDFTLTYYLDPLPFLKAGNKLKPSKRAFGPWVLTAMKVLKNLKVLRGTAFDLFGYQGERKLERKIIDEYRNVVEQALPMLNNKTLGTIHEMATSPQMIAGFGPIKLGSIKAWRERIDNLKLQLT